MQWRRKKRKCELEDLPKLWRRSRWWWWFSHEVVSGSCNPVDCSPLGFFVHGILQARILEWVAISFSRGYSWPKNWTWVFCISGRWFINWAMREGWRSRCEMLIGRISKRKKNIWGGKDRICRDSEVGKNLFKKPTVSHVARIKYMKER